MGVAWVAATSAQTASSSFPYNPDANANEVVDSGDLLSFLTYYGGSFLPTGVLPVEGGGTGVATVDSYSLKIL